MPELEPRFGCATPDELTEITVLRDLRGVYDLGTAAFVRFLCEAPSGCRRLLARARPTPTSGALTLTGTVDPTTGETSVALGEAPALPRIEGRLEVIAGLGGTRGRNRRYSGPGPDLYNPSPDPDLIFSPFVSGGLVVVPERGSPLGPGRSFVVPDVWERAIQHAWQASKDRLHPIRTANPILGGTAFGLRLDREPPRTCHPMAQEAFAASHDARQALFARHLLRSGRAQSPAHGAQALQAVIRKTRTQGDLTQIAVGTGSVALFAADEPDSQKAAALCLTVLASQVRRLKKTGPSYLRTLLRLVNA